MIYVKYNFEYRAKLIYQTTNMVEINFTVCKF